jgi:hypothetical protein
VAITDEDALRSTEYDVIVLDRFETCRRLRPDAGGGLPGRDQRPAVLETGSLRLDPAARRG